MPVAIRLLAGEDIARCTNDERRAAPRHPGNLRIRCAPFGAAGPSPVWTGQAANLSSYGIGLVVPGAPGQGTLMEIELARKNGTPVRTLLARVAHESSESSKLYRVGCAFVRELADEQLRFFHAEAVHPSGRDCRRWTRFACDVETVCYTSDTAPGERRSGKILNISAGGVGLVLRCAFSEGTLLSLDMPLEVDPANPNTLVRVVRVQEQNDGKWLLGCEFTDRLSDEDLKNLLR